MLLISNHTFEHLRLCLPGDLNNAQSWRAASRSMWAPTQGIGPPERHKDPITGRRNIREIWCGVVTRRVVESDRIHMRVGRGIEHFRNTPVHDLTPRYNDFDWSPPGRGRPVRALGARCHRRTPRTGAGVLGGFEAAYPESGKR